MRMIVGLDRPTRGTALIDGKAYSDYTRPLERWARYSTPSGCTHPDLRLTTCVGWLPRMGSPKTRGRSSRHRRAERCCWPESRGFSLGMGQRLALLLLCLGPEVLILDEPVNGLDPEGIRWVRQFVRALAAEGRTVLVSSHLLSEMAQTADHLIVIGKGRLIADTSTRDFIKSASEASVVVRSDHLTELGTALEEENTEFHKSVDADGRPTVVVPNRDSDWVGALAYSYGLRLRELSEVRPSLEEAFMRMTGDSVEYQASVSQTAKAR